MSSYLVFSGKKLIPFCIDSSKEICSSAPTQSALNVILPWRSKRRISLSVGSVYGNIWLDFSNSHSWIFSMTLKIITRDITRNETPFVNTELQSLVLCQWKMVLFLSHLAKYPKKMNLTTKALYRFDWCRKTKHHILIFVKNTDMFILLDCWTFVNRARGGGEHVHGDWKSDWKVQVWFLKFSKSD